MSVVANRPRPQCGDTSLPFAGCFTPEGQAEWEAAGLECWAKPGGNEGLWEVRRTGSSERLFLGEYGSYNSIWTWLKGYQAGLVVPQELAQSNNKEATPSCDTQ